MVADGGCECCFLGMFFSKTLVGDRLWLRRKSSSDRCETFNSGSGGAHHCVCRLINLRCWNVSHIMYCITIYIHCAMSRFQAFHHSALASLLRVQSARKLFHDLIHEFTAGNWREFSPSPKGKASPLHVRLNRIRKFSVQLVFSATYSFMFQHDFLL